MLYIPDLDQLNMKLDEQKLEDVLHVLEAASLIDTVIFSTTTHYVISFPFVDCPHYFSGTKKHEVSTRLTHYTLTYMTPKRGAHP